jgi:hypothetical protein
VTATCSPIITRQPVATAPYNSPVMAPSAPVFIRPVHSPGRTLETTASGIKPIPIITVLHPMKPNGEKPLIGHTSSPSYSQPLNTPPSPSYSPTLNTTPSPSFSPTLTPTQSPLYNPTLTPTQLPLYNPTLNPTQSPNPTAIPTLP